MEGRIDCRIKPLHFDRQGFKSITSKRFRDIMEYLFMENLQDFLGC
jgi:hypothetical protein